LRQSLSHRSQGRPGSSEPRAWVSAPWTGLWGAVWAGEPPWI